MFVAPMIIQDKFDNKTLVAYGMVLFVTAWHGVDIRCGMVGYSTYMIYYW